LTGLPVSGFASGKPEGKMRANRLLALLFAAAGMGSASVSTSAAIWYFDLAGRSDPGMTGGNEVPQNSSSATGQELSPGISYDTSTHQLTLHFGWGSADAAGNGIDLGSDFLGAYIQGPANSNGTTTGGVLYDLTANETDLSDGGRSGFIDLPDIGDGNPPALQLVDNPKGSGWDIATQEQQLHDSQWYLNLASDAIPGGEIRGQLILTAVPEPEEYTMIAGLLLLGFGVYRRARSRELITY
jgi:hypothetical protein